MRRLANTGIKEVLRMGMGEQYTPRIMLHDSQTLDMRGMYAFAVLQNLFQNRLSLGSPEDAARDVAEAVEALWKECEKRDWVLPVPSPAGDD